MYCRQCGFNNDKYSKMCKRCGSDLARPTEEYRPAAVEPGQLRFAAKKETIGEWFKNRFRKLERAARDRSHLKPFIIAAVCIVTAAAAAISIPAIISCTTVIPDTYGDTACNVATQGDAAVYDDFLFCSQYTGDNPGLYRIKLSTGEQLKISWRVMSQMSWYDGWLYGVDDTGTLLRISPDGITEQVVLEEKNVHHVSLYNNCVYYIRQGGAIFRASLEDVSEDSFAIPEVVRDVTASEMIIFDGVIYYIEQMDYAYEPGLPMEHVIEPDYEPGKISKITGKEIPPKYEVVPADAELPVGFLCRMNPDGSILEADRKETDDDRTPSDSASANAGASKADREGVLVSKLVCNISAYGEYLYYMTQTEVEVPASEYDHNAPGNIRMKASSCQFWRYNLVTDKYTRFLDEGASRSPLNVTQNGICFVSVGGDLEICPTSGGSHDLLPTGAEDVAGFTVVNNVIYYTANDRSQVGWINMDGSEPMTLWEAEWGAVYETTDTSGGDVVE